jgi:hypothetical protein
MMQHLAPGTHPPLISGDVPLPNTKEIRDLLAELAKLTQGNKEGGAPEG